MKLSSETISVLKNFATINSNIVFRGGNEIKTMSDTKNILAKATVPDTFPDTTFGIYDLSKFLSVMGMFDSPDIDVYDSYIRVGEGSQAAKYFVSDPEILTSPSKDIQMPEAEVSFDLRESDLTAIRRAVSTLGAPDLLIECNGTEVVTATLTDVEDSTSNTFSLSLNTHQAPPTPFRFVFNPTNLKLMGGTDYRVDISSKLISHFTGTNDLEYWVALEKTSTFG